MPAIFTDYIVVGGGLAGLTAAWGLAEAGSQVVLVDKSPVENHKELGGFASFSGAKFSLPPAGQGLVPVAGGMAELTAAIRAVCDLCGLTQAIGVAIDSVDDTKMGNDHSLRNYVSIVLTPAEITHMIQRIEDRLRKTVGIVYERVDEITFDAGRWVAKGSKGDIASAPMMICTGGRGAGALLNDAGAVPQRAKGIDLGIRLEFMDRTALRSLRALGPDAKVLMGKTRTFCLNYPGIVYRYPFRGITIPGGIVADQSHLSANVGILTRIPEKHETLEAVITRLHSILSAQYERVVPVRGLPFGDKADVIEMVYGSSVANELHEFAVMTQQEGLIDWDFDHMIHFPLLDWHWDTFGVGTTHRTTLRNMYVAGDSAGHARGLLQAGISGWLAAQEMLIDARV